MWLWILLLLMPGVAVGVETLEYEVVREHAAFELRRYPQHLVAEVEVRGGFEKVGGEGFRVLADYIFGNNRGDEKIAMTAPVTQRPAAGERIGMTAPVTQRPAKEGAPGTYRIAFVMPRRFTRETLPEPVDPRVEIRTVAPRLMAARRYSGRWTEEKYRTHEAALLDAVRAAGLEVVGTPVYARYNSPFSLWFLRRNEVLVEVRERAGGD